ncbi:MAG: DNA-binding NtrC family response regulator [Desulforhopalus sp.]
MGIPKNLGERAFSDSLLGKISTHPKRVLLMLTEMKMLLVDGDEGIRKALVLFFETRNCQLHTVENATQALSAIGNNLYDIIICEQLLPDMNGLTFFENLKNTNDRAIKFLITSYGYNPTREELHATGIDHLLSKPFSGEEIEETIIRFIHSKDVATETTYVETDNPSEPINNQR